MTIMTKTLYVPSHVKKGIEKKKEVKIPYIEPGNRVLDPSLLDKSLLERLPQPTGWRV